MPKIILLFFLVLARPALAAVWSPTPTGVAHVAADDEYDRYRKKGDDFFREGRYLEARRQYQNCLEVPNFENDPYAREQIEKCTKGIAIRQQADAALQNARADEAIDLYKQLLTFNADDTGAKAQLSDYYERQGNSLYNQQKYAEARSQYQQALQYSLTRQETLRLQIYNSETNLKPVVISRPNRQLGLKLFTGAVAVGSAAYAVYLRSNFIAKKNTLVELEQSLDPTNSGMIASRDQYQQYEAAYNAAEAARKQFGLYKVCLGVAAVATLAEVYMLIKKPLLHHNAWRIQPASESWGLAVRRHF